MTAERGLPFPPALLSKVTAYAPGHSPAALSRAALAVSHTLSTCLLQWRTGSGCWPRAEGNEREEREFNVKMGSAPRIPPS